LENVQQVENGSFTTGNPCNRFCFRLVQCFTEFSYNNTIRSGNAKLIIFLKKSKILKTPSSAANWQDIEIRFVSGHPVYPSD